MAWAERLSENSKLQEPVYMILLKISQQVSILRDKISRKIWTNY